MFEANLRSDGGTVSGGFHWHSWFLTMKNMRWSQLISYITCSRLANLMMNGIIRILSMMQQRASNHWSVANLWCTGSLRPRTHFEVKAMEKMHTSTPFRYTSESSGSVMSLVTTNRTLHICQSHLAIMSGEVLLSSCVRIRGTGSQIHSNAAAFAREGSNFRCTGESSPYVLSRVITAEA
jgi:hypothetical protein